MFAMEVFADVFNNLLSRSKKEKTGMSFTSVLYLPSALVLIVRTIETRHWGAHLLFGSSGQKGQSLAWDLECSFLMQKCETMAFAP